MYFEDVSDAVFESFIPKKIREGPPPNMEFDNTLTHTLTLPQKVIQRKTDRLTTEINKNAFNQGAGPYTNIKIIQGKTFVVKDYYLTNIEVWYHQSGKSHGKVVNAQIAFSRIAEFPRMVHAHVIRNEPEDRMILKEGNVGGPNYSPWSKYELI